MGHAVDQLAVPLQGKFRNLRAVCIQQIPVFQRVLICPEHRAGGVVNGIHRGGTRQHCIIGFIGGCRIAHKQLIAVPGISHRRQLHRIRQPVGGKIRYILGNGFHGAEIAHIGADSGHRIGIGSELVPVQHPGLILEQEPEGTFLIFHRQRGGGIPVKGNQTHRSLLLLLLLGLLRIFQPQRQVPAGQQHHCPCQQCDDLALLHELRLLAQTTMPMTAITRGAAPNTYRMELASASLLRSM